ncbi:type IV secretion system protein VirD [Ensifer sp. MPMI2T]|nr:type IV secretion system protein VirD [Ensifer sp. MPMI2T]
MRRQLEYLSRRGAVDLQRSERHQGIVLLYDHLDELARSWAEHTGNYQPVQPDAESNQELTAHIVVSFPRATDRNRAHAAGRARAANMFGSGRNGGTFDYITAFHVYREHPHLHVVVNRRALEGHWLKISRRHPHLNYINMRAALVDAAAYDNGIELNANSRSERGMMERPITYAEFRRRQRTGEAIATRPQPEPNVPATPRGTSQPPSLNDNNPGPRLGGGLVFRSEGAGQASGSNAGPLRRDDNENDFRADHVFDQGGQGDLGGLAIEQGQSAEENRQHEDHVGPWRRRDAPSMIETRAERAAREWREAAERVTRNAVASLNLKTLIPTPSQRPCTRQWTEPRTLTYNWKAHDHC